MLFLKILTDFPRLHVNLQWKILNSELKYLKKCQSISHLPAETAIEIAIKNTTRIIKSFISIFILFAIL